MLSEGSDSRYKRGTGNAGSNIRTRGRGRRRGKKRPRLMVIAARKKRGEDTHPNFNLKTEIREKKVADHQRGKGTLGKEGSGQHGPPVGNRLCQQGKYIKDEEKTTTTEERERRVKGCEGMAEA